MDLISSDWKHIEKIELKLLKNPIIKLFAITVKTLEK